MLSLSAEALSIEPELPEESTSRACPSTQLGLTIVQHGSPCGELPFDPAAPLVRAYHERTKHHVGRYARGPETLDWDAQPAPFRNYGTREVVALPLSGELAKDDPLALAFDAPMDLSACALRPPIELSLRSLSLLLLSSLGITAWKSYGPDRWAVRANPSSGNLHPVEAYVVACGSALLDDGVYHYLPDQHALERRARWAGSPALGSGVFIALSSVMWREAWKYGERAFRYCQLDVGHAVGALGVAAACLGATLREETAMPSLSLASLLGIELRTSHLAATEREEPELLLRLGWRDSAALPMPLSALARVGSTARFEGAASTIDPRPLYQWPVIDEVACATRSTVRVPTSAGLPVHSSVGPALAKPQHHELGRRWRTPALASASARPRSSMSTASVRSVLLGRRSAQRFDSKYVMSQRDFFGIIEALRPAAGAPWTTLAARPMVDLALFVHRVEGLDSGLYVLSRRGTDSIELLALLASHALPCSVPGGPAQLKHLRSIPATELMRVARALHCHQDIAATSCFAVAMLAEFVGPIGERAASYRNLHREAGLIGQLLYIGAEAHGLRGTGIGCFFDDSVHELLGLRTHRYQSLYHFTVGRGLDDPRVEFAPAYPARERS